MSFSFIVIDYLLITFYTQALALLEGLIPGDENEHKESNYERTVPGVINADLDAPPLDMPELTLDLKSKFFNDIFPP